MGVAERKERDKLARRLDILHAARECFFKRGFDNATIQQIAERVELSTGTIYLYFQSKEEIYISILEEGLDVMQSLFRAAITPGQSAVEGLQGIVAAFQRFHHEYGEYLTIMAFMRISSERSTAIPDAQRQRVQEQVEGCYGIVEEIIQRGIDGGELRPVNTRDFAQVLWAMMTGLVLSHEQAEDGGLTGLTGTAQPQTALTALIDLASSLVLNGARISSGQPATSS